MFSTRVPANVFKLHKKPPPCARGRKTRIDRPRIGHRSTLGRPSTTALFVPSVRPRSNPDGTLSRPAAPSPPPNSALGFVGLLPEFCRYGRKTDGPFYPSAIVEMKFVWHPAAENIAHYTKERKIDHVTSISTSYKTATDFVRLSYADHFLTRYQSIRLFRSILRH